MSSKANRTLDEKNRINFSKGKGIKAETEKLKFNLAGLELKKKEIKEMAEAANLNQEQSLIKPDVYNGEDKTSNEYLNDFKGQAQEYGQKFQDAAIKAKDYAGEKFTVASEKFKELQSKDPKELMEDAKEFARQKPGQALLISAAAGLIIGFLLKRR